MLTAKILNSDAILNNFKEITTLKFLSGESKTLKMRLHNQDLDLRYVPISGATISVVFNLSDDTTLTISGSFDTDDRSIVTVALTAVQTATLLGGNISFTLTESAVISKGLVSGALTKVIEGDC